MNNYVIYDTSSGQVSMMFQTSDQIMLNLNTPAGHSAIISDTLNLNEIEGVNVQTHEIIKIAAIPN